MPKITLDPATSFYATPSEVAAWLQECFRKHDLAYVFSKVPCRLTTDVDRDSRAAIHRTVRQHSDLFLATDALDLNVTHVNQLAYRNPESLLVTLPRRASYGLLWGTIGAGTRVARHVRVWRKFAAALEARMTPGVWYGAPGRPQPLHDRDVWYTPGAAELWTKGVPLLGGGSTRIVRLDSEKPKTQRQRGKETKIRKPGSAKRRL